MLNILQYRQVGSLSQIELHTVIVSFLTLQVLQKPPAMSGQQLRAPLASLSSGVASLPVDLSMASLSSTE